MTPRFLNVEHRSLPDQQVIHRLLLFHSNTGIPDKVIRPIFRSMRQRVTEYGLDLDSLLHVGVPEVVDGQLVSYDCCISAGRLAPVKVIPRKAWYVHFSRSNHTWRYLRFQSIWNLNCFHR